MATTTRTLYGEYVYDAAGTCIGLVRSVNTHATGSDHYPPVMIWQYESLDSSVQHVSQTRAQLDEYLASL